MTRQTDRFVRCNRRHIHCVAMTIKTKTENNYLQNVCSTSHQIDFMIQFVAPIMPFEKVTTKWLGVSDNINTSMPLVCTVSSRNTLGLLSEHAAVNLGFYYSQRVNQIEASSPQITPLSSIHRGGEVEVLFQNHQHSANTKFAIIIFIKTTWWSGWSIQRSSFWGRTHHHQVLSY